VHFLPVRVYYEDTDFTGLVYHANYVRYFERGRSDFLRLAGVGHAQLLARADPAAFVVTSLCIDFTYDVARGARLDIAQAILRGENVIATAAVAAACIALDGRPRRPPVVLVEKLTPFLQPAP
jgi:acyl-CoA thioester hydrolase